MEGRCMKCKENREMENEEDYEMTNGMMAKKGTCPVCGTKMFKIVGEKK